MRTNTMMIPVVNYYRYSSSGQNEQSIEGQQRACLEYCRRHGFTVIGEYIDRAFTGTNDNRPEFQRMIKDAKRGGFEFVVCYKYDRFARNRYDSVVYKHKLKEAGVRVLSAMEAISDDEGGRTVEAIYEVWAEWYSEDLSKKAKRGLKLTAEKGLFTGGNILLGYKVEKQQVIIDEDKAPAVRFAFEQYAKGTPKKKIVAALNEKGLTTLSGKPFTINSFQDTLRNRKYIGQNYFNGVLSPGYPPLIEEDLFNKVQRLLDAKKRAPAAGKAKTDYILQGKLFCGHCGTQMVGVSGTGRHGDKHYYYACAKRYKEKTCDKKIEKKDFIEWYVVEQTVKWVLNPEYADKIADTILASYENSVNGRTIKEYEQRLSRLEKELDRCFDLLLKATTPEMEARANAHAAELELQKQDLSTELAKLRLLSAVKHTKEDIIGWLNEFTKGDIMDDVYRRRIIKLFVHSVWLYDDKVVLYYNIEGARDVSYIDVAETLEEEGFVFDSLHSANAPQIRTPYFICVKGRFGVVIWRK